jgi:hypothetical protein
MYFGDTVIDSFLIVDVQLDKQELEPQPRALTFIVDICATGAELNPFISYYEPGYYNTSQVAASLAQHLARTKRSAGPTTHHHTIHINFKAHERYV